MPGAQRDLQVGNSSSRAGAKSQFQVDFLRPENASEMPEICISCPKTLFEWEKNERPGKPGAGIVSVKKGETEPG